MLRRFLLELGLWYAVSSIFMGLYVLRFARPAAAIAPHLVVITLPLLALFCIRLLLVRCLPARDARVWSISLLTSATFCALCIYYVLVLIGLYSWGGVVAWNVIPSFFAQASVLADTLDISTAVLFAGMLAIYLLINACLLIHFSRGDWAEVAVQRLSAPLLGILIVAALGVLTIEGLQLQAGVWTHNSEPVSLTMHPFSVGGLDLEGLRVNPITASTSARREDAARSVYSPATGTRNLILIVVDALRPDHMGLYGYTRSTTPNLLRIAQEHATRVVNDVHATCGDTACAMFSLFSSQYPSDFSFRPFFLQDALRRNGYRLHLLLSGDHSFFFSLKPFYGLVDTFYDGNQAHGFFVNDDNLLVDRLATMPDWDNAPVMFQFHLMSAHILRKRDRETGNGTFEPASRYAFQDSRDTGPGGQSPQSAINFYDNGVVQADEMIEKLLGTLQKKGYLQNTLVVITADHGESLGEHGLFHHANSVREELLRIPLILISYGYDPLPLASHRTYPSQVDIAPTIMSELDLPRPDSWAGSPLQEPGGETISYFTEHSIAGLIDRSDRGHVWKYWRDPASKRERVFDLMVDPKENNDLAGVMPPRQLFKWRGRMAAQIQASLPDP